MLSQIARSAGRLDAHLSARRGGPNYSKLHHRPHTEHFNPAHLKHRVFTMPNEQIHGHYAYTALKDVIYGPGCLKEALPNLMQLLGVKKALIVTGKSLNTKVGFNTASSTFTWVNHIVTDRYYTQSGGYSQSTRRLWGNIFRHWRAFSYRGYQSRGVCVPKSRCRLHS